MNTETFILTNLTYCSQTGMLSWRAGTYGYQRNKGHAGTINNKGYRTIKINGHDHMVHRVVWFLYYGNWPDKQVDHEDLNKQNNRIENLRSATNTENCGNQGMRINNSSGYKGVQQLPSGRWKASLSFAMKSHYVGSFDTAKEAATAYELKAASLRKDFFCPTFNHAEAEAA